MFFLLHFFVFTFSVRPRSNFNNICSHVGVLITFVVFFEWRTNVYCLHFIYSSRCIYEGAINNPFVIMEKQRFLRTHAYLTDV